METPESTSRPTKPDNDSSSPEVPQFMAGMTPSPLTPSSAEFSPPSSPPEVLSPTPDCSSKEDLQVQRKLFSKQSSSSSARESRQPSPLSKAEIQHLSSQDHWARIIQDPKQDFDDQRVDVEETSTLKKELQIARNTAGSLEESWESMALEPEEVKDAKISLEADFENARKWVQHWEERYRVMRNMQETVGKEAAELRGILYKLERACLVAFGVMFVVLLSAV